MAESQSRYSIMEEFNQKKINARARLAGLVKEQKQEELKYNQNKQNLNSQLTNEKANYKINHQNWITNQKLEIKLRQTEMQQEINNMQREIDDAEATFETDHTEIVAALEQKLKDLEYNYTKYTDLKELDQKAIEEEIMEIDSAIASLKDISVAQPPA